MRWPLSPAPLHHFVRVRYAVAFGAVMLTEVGAKELKKALPKCSIFRYGVGCPWGTGLPGVREGSGRFPGMRDEPE